MVTAIWLTNLMINLIKIKVGHLKLVDTKRTQRKDWKQI